MQKTSISWALESKNLHKKKKFYTKYSATRTRCFNKTAISHSHAKRSVYRRSKAIPIGHERGGIALRENHWIMLIASDEWYYSVIPGTLVAIHLAPSLPVISQPHGSWERVGRNGAAGLGNTDASRAFAHHPFRSGSRFVHVHVFGIMPRFRNHPARCSFGYRYRHMFRLSRYSRCRREINHLADKCGEERIRWINGIGGVLL